MRTAAALALLALARLSLGAASGRGRGSQGALQADECRYSDWSRWSHCYGDVEATRGVRNRTRSVELKPRSVRKCPGELVQEEQCDVNDCIVSRWSSWSTCVAKCPDLFLALKREFPDFNKTTFTAPGSRYRTRMVVREPRGAGRLCPEAHERRQDVSCMKECRAPVDCEMSEWADWGECSAKCRGGEHNRTRHIISQPRYGGKDCGPEFEVQPCNTGLCEEDCLVSAWGPWSNCSESCGNGTRVRTRSVERAAKTGGRRCPALREEEQCNTHHCPIDCVPGEWAPWSECSLECGGGVQRRRKLIVMYEDFGGKPCANTTENRTCNTQECDVDCEMSPWTAWSQCSVECGGWGTQNRTRDLVTPQAGNGTECPLDYEQRNCTGGPCKIDCEVTPWGEWAQCSRECGGGKSTRQRFILQRPQFGGKECPALNQTKACNEVPCPYDCIVGSWSAWSNCSEWCGNGTQLRTRDIKRHPIKDGALCPALNESRPCFNVPCPVDCEVGGWSKWSECSAECGRGRKHRTRPITKHPQHGGERCPAVYEEDDCQTPACPVDCVVSSWGNWTECDPVCGPDSKQKRVRKVLVPDDFGGEACPPKEEMVEERKCDLPCPADCVVGHWKDAGECNKRCGGGVVKMKRHVISPATHGGDACPALEKERECNTFPCAQPVVDTECADATCGECVGMPGCGYSPSAKMCMRGNETGPTPLWSHGIGYMEDPRKEFIEETNAHQWTWLRCPQDPCRGYPSAATCISDHRCGWCSDDDTCIPGDDRGPAGAGSCAVESFLRWPGYHPRMTARLRKQIIVVPTREQLVAYARAEDDEQRLAVWNAASDDLQHKQQAEKTCTPCEGTYPSCDCTGLLSKIQFDVAQNA